jgi:hypothetical protein
MVNANYHIFGLGLGIDDLHYIGWTQKSLSEEPEQIYSHLAENSSRDIAHWVKAALHCGKISIFEIESVPSMEDAKDSALSWCRYFCSLGLDVVTDPC